MSDNAARKAGRAQRIVWPLLVAMAASGHAAADTAAMQSCRQLSDPAARLACYDAVVLPATPGPAEKPNPAPTATPAAPAVAAVAKPQNEFGLEGRKPPAPEVPYLESAIEGRFDGWVARQRFRLSNGQLWEISDGSEAAYRLRDPKVKITRGLAGTFFMEVEGVSQTPRVRRVE